MFCEIATWGCDGGAEPWNGRCIDAQIARTTIKNGGLDEERSSSSVARGPRSPWYYGGRAWRFERVRSRHWGVRPRGALACRGGVRNRKFRRSGPTGWRFRAFRAVFFTSPNSRRADHGKFFGHSAVGFGLERCPSGEHVTICESSFAEIAFAGLNVRCATLALRV